MALTLPGWAVNTSHWVHTSEADFKKGTFKNVVATNLGDVKLSRAIKTILEQDPKVSAVYCLAEGSDGTIYAGTGPHGALLRVKGDQVSTVFEAEGVTNILSLLVDGQGRVLIGTGGETGKVLRIDKPGEKVVKPVEVFAANAVQYVWSMVLTPDGTIYAATGPSGEVFEIKANGDKSVLLDSDENNVLSLISDGKDLLYAGTDPNGLVYRINRKTREVFVVFDAPESEVSALALDGKGNLYAGTAEASEKQPGVPGGEGSKEKAGRPEGTGGVPIPAQPPENPKPPAVPDPNPGEPNPIPKGKVDSRKVRGWGDEEMRGPVYLAIGGWERVLKLDDDPEDPGQPPQPPPPTPGPGPGKHPMPAKPGAVNAAAANPQQQAQAAEPIEFGKPKPEGNAIYKIDADGFVREIFRQPVMVMTMVERGGVLLVGTGSDGLVYQVDPAAEETVVLAKVNPKQVLAMLATRDGRIVLGMSNVGGIASMSSGFADAGTFTSPVLDASQISRFGKIHLRGSLPKETRLTIATRSGNVQDPDKTGWSNWSRETAATSFVQVTSPPARFMQYRLSFSATGGRESPVVDEVDVAYQMPNLAPLVKSIKVGNEASKAGATPANGAEGANAVVAAIAANGAAAANKQSPRSTVEPITWEAEDANGDPVQYSIYFRTGSKAPWVLLKDKLTETRFDWETRAVADGRYEVKVVASDAQANVPGQGRSGSRVSDPLVIDNTPPVIGDLKTETKGGSVHVTATIVDRMTTVASLEYSVDSGGDWQAVLPSDNIFDGPQEQVDFTIGKLGPGAHQVTLRGGDAKGNYAYETVLVNIEAQAGK
jgi:WD40 repeat protein